MLTWIVFNDQINKAPSSPPDTISGSVPVFQLNTLTSASWASLIVQTQACLGGDRTSHRRLNFILKNILIYKYIVLSVEQDTSKDSSVGDQTEKNSVMKIVIIT